jgi:glycosyltransferase involved in cell wall biosynthesis
MTAEVALIAYGLDRAPGGIGRYTRELRRALRDIGVPLTTLHAGRASGERDTLELPAAGRLPALLTIGQVEIAILARRHRLRLVHDPTGTAPLALVDAHRVVTIHDAIPYVHGETSTLLDRAIQRAWLPSMARRVDRVVTDSENSKQDLVRHLRLDPEQVTVIPPGVGPAFRPVPSVEAEPILRRYGIRSPYLLCVGSIEARKNLSRLLEAFAEVHASAPEWSLAVVGARKWKFGPVLETLDRLRLGDAIRFTGYVDDRDLPALYGGAGAFVFPSLYEGFGLPVIEAMACGTPVITSTSSSLPEVAGSAALLVDPRDVTALAEAMYRVLMDDALAGRLREDGINRARRFTWDRTGHATVDLYERLLGYRLHKLEPAA